ncbi:MAG: hypothetical protein AAF628_17415 [Planctomycetota bacterium]
MQQRTGLWLALVLVVSFCAFSPSLLHGYVFDDKFYVQPETPSGEVNPMVAELRPVSEYFQRPYNWGVSQTRGFRPLTVQSFALVNALGGPVRATSVLGLERGDAAWLHHLVNVLLHIGATALVFALVRPLVGPGAALLAALVFGVHPLHAEAVVWIVGRAEVLAFGCGAAATLTLVAAQRARGGGRLARLLVAALLLFGSCAAKESGLAWAGVAPLYAWLRGQRDPSVRPAAVSLLALAVPVAVYLWLRHQVIAAHVTPFGAFEVPYDHNPLFGLSWFERLPGAVMVWGHGLAKVLLPLTFSVSYRAHAIALPETWADPRVIGAALALGAVGAGSIWAARRQPVLALAGLAFVGLAAVTANVLVPVETLLAERFYYGPCLAVACVAGWLAHCVATTAQRRVAVGGAVCAWVVWGLVASVDRSLQWRDDATLFAADVVTQPDCIELHLNAANHRFNNFDAAGGEAHLRRAVELGPDLPGPLLRLAEHTLGAAVRAAKGKKPKEAAQHFGAAETLMHRALDSPHYRPSIDGLHAHLLLFELHRQHERADEARAHLERAVACDPRSPHARVRLIHELREAGDHERIIELLAEGERHRPGSPHFAQIRGDLAFASDDHPAAVEAFARSLPELPDELHVVESWCRYALSLHAVGRVDDALEIAQHYRGHQVPDELHERFEALLRADP